MMPLMFLRLMISLALITDRHGAVRKYSGAHVCTFSSLDVDMAFVLGVLWKLWYVSSPARLPRRFLRGRCSIKRRTWLS